MLFQVVIPLEIKSTYCKFWNGAKSLKSTIYCHSSGTKIPKSQEKIERTVSELIKESTMANVFVSHRKADDQEAERLANEIQNAGHQV
jgi:hypothetical protein